jgi:predicted RNA-binding Zn ribbon-like protein
LEHRGSSEWRADLLVGGHVALDFVNTAGGRTKARDAEQLGSYADLVSWSVAAGVLSEHEMAWLRSVGAERARSGESVLAQAIAWREAAHGFLMAVQAGEPLPEAERRAVETGIRESLAEAHLAPEGPGLSWHADPRDPLVIPLTRVRLAAEDLFTGELLQRVRNCERCSWLYLDRSRGRPRRWCSMALCGNRAKVARHYARAKK